MQPVQHPTVVVGSAGGVGGGLWKRGRKEVKKTLVQCTTVQYLQYCP